MGSPDQWQRRDGRSSGTRTGTWPTMALAQIDELPAFYTLKQDPPHRAGKYYA